jgi:A/G-specific adenine glycosylase
MLQQTRAEVVAPYFERWMLRFPNVRSLASASESEVLNLWQGLGYYSRARRLRAGAQFLLAHFEGELPRKVDELLSVPGIGPYSAGAIASIAYDQPVPLVDGNVIRVLCRLFALEGDPNRAPLKKQLWELSGEFVPKESPGDFNQGLMELGALVCTPRRASCFACPWQKECRAHAEGRVDRLPELAERPPKTPMTMVVLLLRHRGRFAIQTLSQDARWWAGLDAFPFRSLEEPEGQDDLLLDAARKLAAPHLPSSLSLLAPRVHTVTRFRITIVPCLAVLKEKSPETRYRWLPLHKLKELSLPAPHRRLVSQLSA